MTTGQMDLFAMNAHGDIWQELELGATVEPFTVAGAGRLHFLEEVRPPAESAEGRWSLQAHCDGCGRGWTTSAAESLAGAWRTIESLHQQHLAKGE